MCWGRTMPQWTLHTALLATCATSMPCRLSHSHRVWGGPGSAPHRVWGDLDQTSALQFPGESVLHLAARSGRLACVRCVPPCVSSWPACPGLHALARSPQLELSPVVAHGCAVPQASMLPPHVLLSPMAQPGSRCGSVCSHVAGTWWRWRGHRLSCATTMLPPLWCLHALRCTPCAAIEGYPTGPPLWRALANLILCQVSAACKGRAEALRTMCPLHVCPCPTRQTELLCRCMPLPSLASAVAGGSHSTPGRRRRLRQGLRQGSQP